MEQLTVELHINPEEFEAWYAGMATSVRAVDARGRRIRFPARILRAYLCHDGIHGRFIIRFDADGRFQSIHKSEQV